MQFFNALGACWLSLLCVRLEVKGSWVRLTGGAAFTFVNLGICVNNGQYDWKIVDLDIKQQTNKNKTKQNFSLFWTFASYKLGRQVFLRQDPYYEIIPSGVSPILFLLFYLRLSGLQIRVCNWKLFSHFSTKTYVVGTQKNCLIETVLLSTPDTCLNWRLRK